MPKVTSNDRCGAARSVLHVHEPTDAEGNLLDPTGGEVELFDQAAIDEGGDSMYVTMSRARWEFMGSPQVVTVCVYEGDLLNTVAAHEPDAAIEHTHQTADASQGYPHAHPAGDEPHGHGDRMSHVFNGVTTSFTDPASVVAGELVPGAHNFGGDGVVNVHPPHSAPTSSATSGLGSMAGHEGVNG